MDRDNSWDKAGIEAIVESFRNTPGGLMPALRCIQDKYGWVPRESVSTIAEILNLSRAEVHGVISFYHDFRHEPPGRTVVRVCGAESCQAMGGVVLAEHIAQRLNCEFGSTTSDGAFTLEPVYCLGNCACSPAIVINGELLGRMTPQHFDRKLAALNGDRP
jgi:formate dehydrogenase subunit gamma